MHANSTVKFIDKAYISFTAHLIIISLLSIGIFNRIKIHLLCSICEKYKISVYMSCGYIQLHIPLLSIRNNSISIQEIQN